MHGYYFYFLVVGEVSIILSSVSVPRTHEFIQCGGLVVLSIIPHPRDSIGCFSSIFAQVARKRSAAQMPHQLREDFYDSSDQEIIWYLVILAPRRGFRGRGPGVLERLGYVRVKLKVGYASGIVKFTITHLAAKEKVEEKGIASLSMLGVLESVEERLQQLNGDFKDSEIRFKICYWSINDQAGYVYCERLLVAKTRPRAPLRLSGKLPDCFTLRRTVSGFRGLRDWAQEIQQANIAKFTVEKKPFGVAPTTGGGAAASSSSAMAGTVLAAGSAGAPFGMAPTTGGGAAASSSSAMAGTVAAGSAGTSNIPARF